MYRLVLVALCVLILPTASFAQNPAACADGKCIQVGSYNLELFGSSRKTYGGVRRGARSDSEIDQIVARIADTLDLEIVVFEEINKTSAEWTTLKSKLGARGYQFFEGSSSDRNQFVVLAWDSDEVTLQGTAEEWDLRSSFNLPGGCNESGLRKPVAGNFKAGSFDFWVVGVHLKSRSGEESCNTKIRTEQCKDLVAKIAEVGASSGEHDFLIVGDCNENIGHESFQPLVDAGFIPQSKFLIEGSAKGSYIKNGSLNDSDDLIDHVWLRYAETKEVVRGSAFVMPISSAEAAKAYIISQSDHVPICVSFRTDEDLDDDE